ncbi:MAG: phage terminase small subunit P27 family [Chloroflexota bacterium]|nr:phage terminase small subunit P27 family [Chloroflexota bacterium]
MPRRGRKPLPTKLKLIRGTLRSDRRNAKEASLSSGLPTCPRALSPAAKREWKRVAHELAQAGLLTRVDRAGLAAYCAAWSRWIEAEEALRTYGTIIKSPSGYPMVSPYFSVASKSLEQMRLLLGEFGMTPSSRSRVNAQPEGLERESKWAGLL